MSRRAKLPWLNALLVVVVAVALAGCGGGDSDTGASVPSTSASVTSPPPFEADRALIALADLPAGWAVDRDDSDNNNEFCGTGADLKSQVDIETVDKADAQFAEGGNVPVLLHAVGVYPVDQASTAFDRFRSALTGCTSLTLDDGQKLKVAPVSFPSLGDESVPLLFSGEVEGFPVAFYVIVVRVADGVTIIAYGGLSPDVSDAERFARLATDKLGQAQSPSP